LQTFGNAEKNKIPKMKLQLNFNNNLRNNNNHIFNSFRKRLIKDDLNQKLKEKFENYQKVMKTDTNEHKIEAIKMHSINQNNEDKITNNNNNDNNYNNKKRPNIKTIKITKESSNSNLSFRNININNNYKNILLPIIKLNNINEDSKREDSFNNSLNKKKQETYLRLPKIPQKNKLYGGIGAFNFMNSNEFKKIKHNISNNSIDKGISAAFTQYEKKQKIDIRKKINELKKHYISPYSKKTIENNIII
jgi:hypothetical protein